MQLTISAARACGIAAAFLLPLLLVTPVDANQLNVHVTSSAMHSNGAEQSLEEVINNSATGTLVAGQTVESLVRSGDTGAVAAPGNPDAYFVQARAKADYGTLGVSAQSIMVNNTPLEGTHHAFARASSSWFDTVTIGGAPAGSPVTILTTIVIDISQMVTDGLAETTSRHGLIRFFMSNQPGNNGWCVVAAGGVGAAQIPTNGCPEPIGQLHVGSNLISFETETTVGDHDWYSMLDAHAVVERYAYGRSEGSAWADAIHTAHSYFTVLTPNATMQWASGHDYSLPAQAVPEPETYALMLLGLGALGFVARRRRH